MNMPDWEQERLNMRHRSSSISGAAADWSTGMGYPRPGHPPTMTQPLPGSGYPPPPRRPMNSSSAWDLTLSQSGQPFLPVAPNREMHAQQVFKWQWTFKTS